MGLRGTIFARWKHAWIRVLANAGCCAQKLLSNDAEYHRCCRYVVNNPVKARFSVTPEAWTWSSAHPAK
jgi:hypothetical protein